MTELVKLRGLSRKGVRVGNGQLTNTVNRVVDLDDPTSRRDLQHHSAIGQFISVGDIPAAVATGAVTTSTGNAQVGVTAGTLKREDGQTVTISANAALATAADATNPRISLVTAANADGALAVTAGTAAATPTVPRPPADVTVLAQVRVLPSGGPGPTVVTDVAPRLL